MSAQMAPVHRELMSRVGSPPKRAVMIDTPYGFQENADELSKRALDFFQRKLGRPMEIASLRNRETADQLALERLYVQLADSEYIFAGPGSPSYALRHWSGTRVPENIGRHLLDGGCVTFASAAAITLGKVALPVYEIYKVGLAAHWLPGLNLLAPLGLDFAVIPHYDNTEGGSHDTSYCYMGERRLLQLEGQLPQGVGILGVAEHTAAIFDFDQDMLEVRGRGYVAIRQAGAERLYPTGARVGLAEVRSRVSSKAPLVAARWQPSPEREVERSLLDSATRHRRDFDRAIERSDLETAVATLLELDTQVSAATADGYERETLERARSIYRGMLVRLAEAAQRGVTSRTEPVPALIELALRLRDEARRDHRYSEADLVRDALAELGIEVRDTPVGPEWSSRTEH
ncbi:MAG TPA: hypothetical protein VFR68_03250 [Candidatus Dormibacteraeota bacterium]|nr:hypothetical protein [Candidatus Dormibacteraeota bacterium]